MGLPAERVLPEGRLFDRRWRIVRCIRSGGMGAVYEVVHEQTQARSALKVMLPELVTSSELRSRFRQEALVTAKIESDHIVKVFDGGTDPDTGSPYLVMELLRGEDLGSRIARSGPLRPDLVVTLLSQVAMALDRTHQKGVIHRDLKPENLFVTTRDDGSPCVKILDFGVAKLVASPSRAETTRTVGTPLYMSPEQVRGDGSIGAAADLFAVGQIAYTLLVGTPYWATEKRAHDNVYPLLMAITAGASEPASARAARAGVTLPGAFDDWFAKATALEPEARHASASALVNDLAIALGLDAEVIDAPPVEPVASRATMGLALAALLGAIAVAAAWTLRAEPMGTLALAPLAAAAPSVDRRAPAVETPAPAPPPPVVSASASSSASARAARRAPALKASEAPVEPPPAPRYGDPSDVYRKGDK
jgi:eukaryotic-like serine/threonine-protein kinase